MRSKATVLLCCWLSPLAPGVWGSDLADGGADQAIIARAIQRELGPDFVPLVTNHFLVFHDRHRAWAQGRARVLQSTHERFYAAMKAADWQVEPLRQRLVCVLFYGHEQFAQYAQAADDVTEDWPGGYYSTRTNRIALYNQMGGPALSHFGSTINRLQSRHTLLKLRLADTSTSTQPALHASLSRQVRAGERQLQQLRGQQSAAAEQANTAKTTHEAIHQLAFNSGLQVRGVLYPFWLSEGLATNFETHDATRPFGPQNDNLVRRRALLEAHRRGTTIPLSHLITILGAANWTPEEMTAAYGQAWGLFHHLFEEQRAELFDYFQIMNQPDPAALDPLVLRRQFVQTFGKLETVDMRWRQFLGRLRSKSN